MSIRVPQPKPVRVTVALMGVCATLLIVTAEAIGVSPPCPRMPGKIPTTRATTSTAAAAASVITLTPAGASTPPLDLAQQGVEHLGTQRRCFRRRVVERFHFLGIELCQQRGDAAQFSDGRPAPWTRFEMRFELAPFMSRQ